MSNQTRPVIIKSFEELNKAELYQIIQLRIAVLLSNKIVRILIWMTWIKMHNICGLRMQVRIVCYLRVNPAGSRFSEPSLGRIVTKKSHRNRGLAEMLIKRAINLVCEKESRLLEFQLSAI